MASKKTKIPINIRLLIAIGLLFHIIVYRLGNKTFYNELLQWGSLLFCGVLVGTYLIFKLELNKPESYRKLEGVRLKLFMYAVSLLMIFGGIFLSGNVINGTLLGLNYLGRSQETVTKEYRIKKITRARRGRRGLRRLRPLVYLKDDAEKSSFWLYERFDSNKNYDEFKTIEFELQEGLFGFEIINDYTLKR